MDDKGAEQLVLAGDIGGTKTRLGLFSCREKRPQWMAIESYSSPDASGLEEMISRFLSEHREAVSSACFGIAGPVIDGRCKLTNLSWAASEDALRQQFKWDNVRLINDLSATGLAIPLLDNAELFSLTAARAEPRGTIGLIAPGTGLGVSLLLVEGDRLIPMASEGGHVDFAPRNENELDLWRHLRRSFHHISAERIVSGPGILAIYSWLKESGEHEEPPWLGDRMKLVDPSIAISEGALHEHETLCVETLNCFVSILGATAGNLALTGMTTGGIYLGGGICPKILPKLQEGIFLEAFTDKGRLRDLLSGIPVRVILDDRAALLGAAWCASEYCRN